VFTTAEGATRKTAAAMPPWLLLSFRSIVDHATPENATQKQGLSLPASGSLIRSLGGEALKCAP